MWGRADGHDSSPLLEGTAMGWMAGRTAAVSGAVLLCAALAHAAPYAAMAPVDQYMMARADEIARSALYLACEQSSFTTGTTLMVDGGMSV